MVDKSCCSCIFSRYEINETDDGTYVNCSKGFEITEKMLIDQPCNEYVKRNIL